MQTNNSQQTFAPLENISPHLSPSPDDSTFSLEQTRIKGIARTRIPPNAAPPPTNSASEYPQSQSQNVQNTNEMMRLNNPQSPADQGSFPLVSNALSPGQLVGNKKQTNDSLESSKEKNQLNHNKKPIIKKNYQADDEVLVSSPLSRLPAIAANGSTESNNQGDFLFENENDDSEPEEKTRMTTFVSRTITRRIPKQEILHSANQNPILLNNPLQEQPCEFVRTKSKIIKKSFEEQSQDCAAEDNSHQHFLALEILGKGGQGKVETFLDKQTNKMFAVKNFADPQEFKHESEIYSYVQSEKSTLHEYVNKMYSKNDSKQTLHLEMGTCNLYELYQKIKAAATAAAAAATVTTIQSPVTKSPAISADILSPQTSQGNSSAQFWQQSQLITLLTRLLSGLLAFRRDRFYHGDIKPQNLMIFPVDGTLDFFTVKYIDLGSAGNEPKDYFDSYTESFLYPKYKLLLCNPKTPTYTLTEENITESEVYSIFRTIWLILCFTDSDCVDFRRFTHDYESAKEFGLEFISRAFPILAEVMDKALSANGNLDELESAINWASSALNDEASLDSFLLPSTSLLASSITMMTASMVSNMTASSALGPIPPLSIRMNQHMTDLIQAISAAKKEKFINAQSEEQLEDLFEIFLMNGLDARAVDVFLELEPAYTCEFDRWNTCNDDTQEKMLYTDEEIERKANIVRQSVDLLKEKGDSTRAILWNRKLFALFSTGKWRNDRQAILESVYLSIILHSRGEIDESLKVAKEAQRKYKLILLTKESLTSSTNTNKDEEEENNRKKSEEKESETETESEDEVEEEDDDDDIEEGGEQFIERKPYFKQNSKKKQQKIEDEIYGQICYHIGHLLIEVRNPQKALKFLQRALQIFKFAKQNILNSSFMQTTPSSSNTTTSTTSAAAAAISLSQHEIDTKIHQTLIKISKACLVLRHPASLSYINQALKLSENQLGQVQNKPLAQSLNIKSNMLRQMEKFDEAIELQQKCLQIRLTMHNHADHRSVSNSLLSLAMLLIKKKQFDAALLKIDECYRMRYRLFSKQSESHTYIAICLRYFGIIFFSINDYKQAEEYFLRSLEMDIRNQDIASQLQCHKNIYELYKKMQNSEKQKVHREAIYKLKLLLSEQSYENHSKQSKNQTRYTGFHRSNHSSNAYNSYKESKSYSSKRFSSRKSSNFSDVYAVSPTLRSGEHPKGDEEIKTPLSLSRQESNNNNSNDDSTKGTDSNNKTNSTKTIKKTNSSSLTYSSESMVWRKSQLGELTSSQSENSYSRNNFVEYKTARQQEYNKKKKNTRWQDNNAPRYDNPSTAATTTPTGTNITGTSSGNNKNRKYNNPSNNNQQQIQQHTVKSPSNVTASTRTKESLRPLSTESTKSLQLSPMVSMSNQSSQESPQRNESKNRGSLVVTHNSSAPEIEENNEQQQKPQSQSQQKPRGFLNLRMISSHLDQDKKPGSFSRNPSRQYTQIPLKPLQRGNSNKNTQFNSQRELAEFHEAQSTVDISSSPRDSLSGSL